MSYHSWGDSDFDWNGLMAAEEYINGWVRDHTAFGLSSKEKYGELRYERIVPKFGMASMGIIIAKDPSNSEWPSEEEKRECWKEVVVAVKHAVSLWPHLEEEIIGDLKLDCPYEELTEDLGE